MIQREHIESALRGIARQVGRDVPVLEHLTYDQLVSQYLGTILFYDCIQMTEEEIEEYLTESIHV